MTTHESQLAQLLQREVTHFLPHQPPMIFIDKLLDYQDGTLTAEVTITASSPYFDPKIDAVPNYVAIEYMAQTMAALAGIEARLSQQDLRIGFLLGSRKLKLHQPHYLQGGCYQIKVKKLLQEESGFGVCDCQVYQQDLLVAEAKINVFLTTETSNLPPSQNEANQR